MAILLQYSSFSCTYSNFRQVYCLKTMIDRILQTISEEEELFLIYEEKLEVVLKNCLKRILIAKVHAVGGDSKLIFLLTLF